MRPVNKWLPGWVTLSDGSPLKIEEDYHPYRKAKRDLCKNLGLFCSYCEKAYQDERDLAERYLNMYRRQKITLDVLLDLVKAYGYWSIWFTVFKTCDEVRAALINEFPGTAQGCFDAQNHYEPVARHPEYLSDPI